MYTVHIYIRYIAYIYLYDKWTYLKDSMEISGSGRPKRNILQSPPPSLPPKNLWQPKSPKKTAISAEKNMKVQLEGRYKSARVLWKPVWWGMVYWDEIKDPEKRFASFEVCTVISFPISFQSSPNSQKLFQNISWPNFPSRGEKGYIGETESLRHFFLSYGHQH